MANEGARQLASKIERKDGTQTAAAQRLGISQGALNDLLSGRRTPSLRLSLAIQSAYGIQPAAWTKQEVA